MEKGETKEIERVLVKGLSKKFNIGYKRNESVLARLLNLISGREFKKEIFVLRNISFKAGQGQNIGIIGRNASGKSTLLKLIAGIYEPYNGVIRTKGKVLFLDGFGQGLKPRLTMRENIFLIGSINGLSQKAIKERFEEIVKFSALRDFVDTKVYQFSSGMKSRLSFSVMIYCIKHSNPDIILLDEVLEVGGDIDFKSKALAKMEDFIKGGTTVIMVSHHLNTLEKYCNEILWIDKGKIVKMGRPKTVIEDYIKANLTSKEVKRYLKKTQERIVA